MTNNQLTAEQIENIIEMAGDAAKLYGESWYSALVAGPSGNFHAITSDAIQDVVVQASDDSRDSSWLCDYLESVSPAIILAALRELQERRKAAEGCKNLNEMEQLAEQAECLIMCLDDLGVPDTEGSESLSLWGRVKIFAEENSKDRAELQERRKPLLDKDLQGVLGALGHPAGINAAGKRVVRSALVELQERRKADSEPVAWTSEEAIAEIYCDQTGMIGPKYMVGDVPLYRHAQPTPDHSVNANEMVAPTAQESVRSSLVSPAE